MFIHVDCLPKNYKRKVNHIFVLFITMFDELNVDVEKSSYYYYDDYYNNDHEIEDAYHVVA